MSIKEIYQKSIIPKMKEKFGYKNTFRVPKIEKIVVAIGTGTALADQKMLDEMKETIFKITGQKPIETKAKKAISGFKLRKGQKVGLKVTMRGKRMNDFFDKLINITLPRTRDFKGVKAAFDGRGNLTIGFKEQIAFPEIEEGNEKLHGLAITICTTAKNNEEAKELLTQFGIRFME